MTKQVFYRVCCILDTETTGLDHEKDEIIEIAIRKWIYHKRSLLN